MKLMKKDIKPNERITSFFALESMQMRKSKTEQHFLALDLHDRSGKIKGYLWNDPIEMAASLREKSYVKVRGITKMINDSIVIDIERIKTAEKAEVDIRDFLEVVPGGIDLWHRKLLESAKLIKDASCRNIVDSFLGDDGFLELFITSPAGISVHHNYVGGLLEHTVSTMAHSAPVAEKNPGLIDKDLLLTGSFLHDIGKTQEIYWEIDRQYTTEGKLLGHIALGFSMVEKKISRMANFPTELALELKHMILSHHGGPEFGSPVRPATPEALALHLIENADAKMNHLYCHLRNSDPDKEWSNYDKYLNTEIYQKMYKRSTVSGQTAGVAA